MIAHKKTVNSSPVGQQGRPVPKNECCPIRAVSLHFKQFYKKKRKISQALGSQWIRLVLMSCVLSVLGAHGPALSAATLW